MNFTTNFTPEELASEEWCPIPGYRGIYAASSLGRIMRLTKGGRLKQPSLTRKGYLVVVLSHKGRRRMHLVHRLVLIAFTGRDRTGKQTNHIDGVKTNNRRENLEWCTHAENMAHAARTHLMARGARHPHKNKTLARRAAKKRRGALNGNTHLNENDVRAIRVSFKAGVSRYELAGRYAVADSTVMNIVRRKFWRHVK